MINKYFVLLRDNKILIKINNHDNTLEYELTKLKEYPYVPSYINIFEHITKYDLVKKIRPLIKDNLKTITEKLLKPDVFIVCEDDTIGSEKKILIDFSSILFNPRNKFLANQCTFLSPKDITDYIAVSRSCRMFILSYVKDRDIVTQKHLHLKDYSVDELKNLIYNLHDDCRYHNLKIFLNGSHLQNYSELGKIVTQYELLNNIQKMLHKLRI